MLWARLFESLQVPELTGFCGCGADLKRQAVPGLRQEGWGPSCQAGSWSPLKHLCLVTRPGCCHRATEAAVEISAHVSLRSPVSGVRSCLSSGPPVRPAEMSHFYLGPGRLGTHCWSLVSGHLHTPPVLSWPLHSVGLCHFPNLGFLLISL